MRFNDTSLKHYYKLHSIEKEGRLWVKHPKDSYKLRWCRLIGNILFYSRVSNKGEIENEPLGIIILEMFSVSMENNADRPFVFSLSFDSAADRKYYLSGTTLIACLEWVNILKKASYKYWSSLANKLKAEIITKTGKEPTDPHLRHGKLGKSALQKFIQPNKLEVQNNTCRSMSPRISSNTPKPGRPAPPPPAMNQGSSLNSYKIGSNYKPNETATTTKAPISSTASSNICDPFAAVIQNLGDSHDNLDPFDVPHKQTNSDNTELMNLFHESTISQNKSASCASFDAFESLANKNSSAQSLIPCDLFSGVASSSDALQHKTSSNKKSHPKWETFE